MSSAALQVKLLQSELSDYEVSGRGVNEITGSYYPKAAEVIDTPWNLAAISDMTRPQAGIQPSKQMLDLAKCLGEARRLGSNDCQIRKLQAEVFHLIKRVSALEQYLQE